MLRSLFLVVAALAVTTCRADDTDAKTKRPPNVIVFLVDDLGGSDIGCYGNRFHETPNVDRLATEGLRFTDAYAACPVCSPTRASIVTGRYPASVNVTDFISGHWRPYAKTIVPRFHFELPHAETTFAEALKPAGYASGAFGKWHLGGAKHYPGSQGFDEWVVTGGRHFAPRFRITTPQPYPAKPKEYYADYLTRRAETFLEDHRDEPFVLYLSHYAVHIPLEAQQRLVKKYERKRMRKEFRPSLRIVVKQPDAEPDAFNDVIRLFKKSMRALDAVDEQKWAFAPGGRAVSDIALREAAEVEPVRRAITKVADELVRKNEGLVTDVRVTAVNEPVYAAMVEHVDESLGRIAQKLDELKLAENTILVFFSDNGGLYRRFDDAGGSVSSQDPLRGEKGSLYEGGIRVPCIVRWPGVTEPGTECREPISSIDLMPTMLEAAGVPVPENVDGTSLLPLLKGAESLERESIFWHYPHYHHTTPAGAIRSGRYKLIEYFEDGRLELYDLARDGSEYFNRAESHPEKARELQQRLAAWRKRVGAKMPTPNPNHDESRAHEWGNRRDRGF